MAQTRKKRRRKHRGTQAGTVEAPGRTGRPRAASSAGRSSSRTGSARSRAARPNRFDQPPTWRSSLNRALIMAGVIVVVLGALQKNWGGAILLGVFALVIYVPATYYMDRAIYRRRQRNKQRPRS